MQKPRLAFTLVEVLLGMVLLASLAIVSMQGFRAHKLQLRFAEQRAIAIAELDRLLVGWENRPEGFPMAGFGIVGFERPWVWRASLIEQRTVFGRPMFVVRIGVFENDRLDATMLAKVDILRGAE